MKAGRQNAPQKGAQKPTEAPQAQTAGRAGGRRQAGKTAGRAARRQAGRAQQSYRPGKKVTDPALDKGKSGVCFEAAPGSGRELSIPIS